MKRQDWQDSRKRKHLYPQGYVARLFRGKEVSIWVLYSSIATLSSLMIRIGTNEENKQYAIGFFEAHLHNGTKVRHEVDLELLYKKETVSHFFRKDTEKDVLFTHQEYFDNEKVMEKIQKAYDTTIKNFFRYSKNKSIAERIKS